MIRDASVNVMQKQIDAAFNTLLYISFCWNFCLLVVVFFLARIKLHPPIFDVPQASSYRPTFPPSGSGKREIS